jgi:hypothetical protein
MSELPPGLEDFGARLERAAEQQLRERRRERERGRGRGLLRNFGLPVGAALAAAAVSAGAVGVVTRDGDPIKPDPSMRPRTAVDQSVVVASAARNPGGGPPWVVRAYTDGEGFECVQLGRLSDGVFGHVQSGQFRPLPPAAVGTCATSAKGPLLAVGLRPAMDLTIVYGLAVDPDPVTVQVGDQVRRVRPVGPGAFVTVFDGSRKGTPIVVRSTVEGRPDVQRIK